VGFMLVVVRLITFIIAFYQIREAEQGGVTPIITTCTTIRDWGQSLS